MRIRDYAGLSDIGSVRDNNEDRWYADPEPGLFIVADGLGGHAAGEVAAQRVVERLPRLLATRRDVLATQPEARVARTLAAAVRALNRAVWREARAHAERRGMGSTVVFAVVLAEAALVVNVGDCRAYLHRAGRLHLITHDHSLAQYLLDQRIAVAGDPRLPLARRQLLQHLGIPGRPRPWMCKAMLAGGDRLLLCSDGLTDMLPDEEISGVLRDEPGALPACTALVDMAKLAGGRDNVTVVLIDFA